VHVVQVLVVPKCRTDSVRMQWRLIALRRKIRPLRPSSSDLICNTRSSLFSSPRELPCNVETT
jgi:hypothetical protein